MITADFFRSGEKLTGFCVKGHAGLDEKGFDICCASVSSAVMLTANTLTEAFKLNADVKVSENEISLSLKGIDDSGDRLILGLLTHLYLLCDEFRDCIRVGITDL